MNHTFLIATTLVIISMPLGFAQTLTTNAGGLSFSQAAPNGSTNAGGFTGGSYYGTHPGGVSPLPRLVAIDDTSDMRRRAYSVGGTGTVLSPRDPYYNQGSNSPAARHTRITEVNPGGGATFRTRADSLTGSATRADTNVGNSRYGIPASDTSSGATGGAAGGSSLTGRGILGGSAGGSVGTGNGVGPSGNGTAGQNSGISARANGGR